MHGRPREYKNKLKEPKAYEGYKKKVPPRCLLPTAFLCHP
jgi:hypothetical protein